MLRFGAWVSLRSTHPTHYSPLKEIGREMTTLVERKIGDFRTRADDGTIYVVIEFQTFTIFTPISGESNEIAGTKRWQLKDGRDVNWIDSEIYEIVESSLSLRRT